MPKRKSAKRVTKKQSIKLDTEFDCPFCYNEKCVEVKMRKKINIADIYCRVCEEKYKYPITSLSQPVDVYSLLIEDCEKANRPKSTTKT